MPCFKNGKSLSPERDSEQNPSKINVITLAARQINRAAHCLSGRGEYVHSNLNREKTLKPILLTLSLEDKERCQESGGCEVRAFFIRPSDSRWAFVSHDLSFASAKARLP